MKCEICKKETLYGEVFNKKKLCPKCLQEGFDFNVEGNVIFKGKCKGEFDAKKKI